MGMRINLLRSRLFASAAAGVLLLSSAFAFSQSVNQKMIDAQSAYMKKEYAKSAALYREAFRLDPKQTVALYNAACSYALGGQKEEAFKALTELTDKGYNDPGSLKSDTDFESLKSDARWKSILSRAEENAKKSPPKPRWTKPYQIVEVPIELPALRSKLGNENSAVWLEGDVLTFLHKSAAAEVSVSGGIQERMREVLNSDLWIFQAKMAGWDKAIVTYVFLEGSVGKVIPKMTIWRGSNSPHAPEEATTLKGQIIERTLHSRALGEDRKINIYLPPEAPKENLPAVFMADGQGCREFAKFLEPLILTGKVRPCAIVGVESAEYRGDRAAGYDPAMDYRARDYVPGQDPERFDKHILFFTEEVGEYVAQEFGISTNREDRAVTGFSNGGAFSAAVAVRKPEFFGTAMPLSLGIPPSDTKPAGTLPRMFFAAGTLESFSKSTTEVHELVKSWGGDSSLDLYVAGHDPAMWDMAFARLMPKVFPTP
jgi:predicted esterase